MNDETFNYEQPEYLKPVKLVLYAS